MKDMSSASVFRFVPGPWSPCSTTCGPGKQTREVKCRVLLSFTKTEVDLPEEECGEDRPQLERPCIQGPCTKVPSISAGLQEQGAPNTQTGEVYSWDYRGFTTCSATCAAGKQTAVVRCVNRKQGEEVEDSQCDSSSRPTVMIRICNPEPCPPRWSVSEWTKCSALCGGGWKQRQVSCQQLDARGAVKTLSAAACERTSRPTDTEQCTASYCPTWVTSPWGKCSGRCLGPTTTVQKRSVTCQHANGSSYTDCDLRDRPPSVRNCSSDLCDVQWRPGAWRACTVVCGSGFQSRRVDCVHRRSGRTLADQHCAWIQRPSTWQHCNTSTCGSECKDTTQYCSVVKRLKLCYLDMYKQRCCSSCSQDPDST
ncbi:ADAMTS-like protein 3 [Plectropomus leopardus]|uniref:ADAMTS-like protein 3 n=1 Tax=Plectropomus leopardus TaxID=160734 RepID=UPI001C4AC104|nr:ADAMTS-like protein 3 [Plectropomus leopardus]